MNWPSQTQDIKPVAEVSPALDALQDKITRWKEADTNQKAWREIELKLRAELVAECFPGTDAGTHNKELANGWKLNVTKPVDYKLDADKTADVLNLFDDTTAELLVKWKPELSVANYKKLSEERQKLFADCLTTKPGSPQLKLLESK